MRIIAGTLGGRLFESPGSNRTHPMSEKTRGALFNVLGDISDMQVLDAFTGSGALAFEAVSRGAASATLVDIDKLATAAAARSADVLGITDQTKVIKASMSAWLNTSKDTFDIIIADPPYDNLQLPVLDRLVSRLRFDGIFVLSWPGSQSVPEFSSIAVIDKKSYGDSQLAFYRQIS